MRRFFPLFWRNLAHFGQGAAVCATGSKALAIPRAGSPQVSLGPQVSAGVSQALGLSAFPLYKKFVLPMFVLQKIYNCS